MRFLVLLALATVAAGQKLTMVNEGFAQEITATVNAAGAKWTAGVNEYFDGVPLVGAKALCGTIRTNTTKRTYRFLRVLVCDVSENAPRDYFFVVLRTSNGAWLWSSQSLAVLPAPTPWRSLPTLTRALDGPWPRVLS
jgi:hypothetical protein